VEALLRLFLKLEEDKRGEGYLEKLNTPLTFKLQSQAFKLKCFYFSNLGFTQQSGGLL